MALDLFAGIPVTDYAAALPWYERFFGGRPAFLPNDTEAVWEVAEHRYVYIVQDPRRAGNALALSFVDDLDERVAELAGRGIEPALRQTLGNGVTKVTYRDADENEISFGGAPKLPKRHFRHCARPIRGRFRTRNRPLTLRPAVPWRHAEARAGLVRKDTFGQACRGKMAGPSPGSG
jgi:hypothetical protein